MTTLSGSRPDPIAAVDFPGVRDDLRRVESVLRESPRSAIPLVVEASTHLVQAGGKRLRPLLAIVGAYAVCPTDLDGLAASDRVVTAAAAVELLHIGSLQHDDVVDEATTRRGVSSANARWGNLLGVLLGDVLLARAAALAASLGAREAMMFAETLEQLSEGQVLEAQYLFNPNRSEEDYLASISGKTASLLGTSAELGALEAGGSDVQLEALRRYGHEFGMAFQIMDDILDVISTEEELGKPTGKDAVEGVYTLPLIRAAQRSAELRECLARPLRGTDAERVRALVIASGAVDEALDAAAGHIASAANGLDGVIDTRMRDQLVRLLDALIPPRSLAPGSDG